MRSRDSRPRRATLLGVMAVVGALAFVGACNQGQTSGGTVKVIAKWTGAEQDNFLAMVKPWQDSTGNTVQYTGTRDTTAVLSTAVRSGLTPDLAGLPGPGEMLDWYSQGALKPLDGVLDLSAYKADTAEGLVNLGTAPDGKVVGIFEKADIKGLIWYNKSVWTGGPPATFDDMMTQGAAAAAALGPDAKTWCLAFESGADTGWPGTDWIENIVLHQAGPDVYDGWIKGTVKWTDPAIKSAWQTFGKVVDAAYGGPQYILGTNFVNTGDKMFSDPPKCVFANMATFISEQFVKTSGAAEGSFDFFAFPDMDPAYSGAAEGGGDLFGMFNDTPEARSLIKYLVTKDAQQILVNAGGAMSANKNVTTYPNEILTKAAQDLAAAKIFRFDAGDAMGAAINSAFFASVAKFVQDQSQLDQILADMDTLVASQAAG